jgi:hypothetical protein
MSAPINRALGDAIEQELHLLGAEIVEAVARYIDKKGINVDGDLRKSIVPEVDRELGRVTLTVGAGAHYAPYVHYGTRPHWAPIDPLKRWVKKKLGLRRQEDVNAAAYGIQRKIAREGTKGRPFMTVPFRLFRDKIAGRIGRRIVANLGSN